MVFLKGFVSQCFAELACFISQLVSNLIYVLNLQIFCPYIVSDFVFMVFLGACICASLHPCMLLVRFLQLFFLSVFILSYSYCYYYFQIPVYIPMKERKRKSGDLCGWTSGENQGGIAPGETVIRTYFMSKIYFQLIK